jgi:signal transduction histidine kinase/pSer/pThr/pTyr-binding forkhead associated (FHA) protein
MPSFFVVYGPDQGRRFEFDGTSNGIGRGGTNQVQLSDTEVSRYHAEVRVEQGHHILLDLESSNGTFLNGDPVDRGRLANGDRVEVGRTRLIYIDDEPAGATVAAENVAIVGDTPEIKAQILQTAGPTIVVGSEDETAQGSGLQQSRRNLDVMYRTALAVSHTLDIDALLARILDLIFGWVDADRGCVMLRQPDQEQLVPRARLDRTGDAGEAIHISETILHYVMESGEGVVTSDASQDDRWEAGASIVTRGVREAICVPMQGRYGVVGAIYIDTFTPPGDDIDRNAHRFTGEHLKLMVAIGHQAALAVEDTTYYGAMLQSERLAAMGQTISTLSHHIKNILQGIKGGGYLIDEGLERSDQEAIRKGWGIVEKNQARISHLVMDMLSFSKSREAELEEMDAVAMVNESLEILSARAREEGVLLSFADAPAELSCRGDAVALQHALLNVIANAIDATADQDQPAVVVSLAIDEDLDEIQLAVEDNGVGMSDEVQAEVFSLFYSSKGNRGTGLGLAVSRKILQEHGGAIHVESSPGKGSRFVLSWPREPGRSD